MFHHISDLIQRLKSQRQRIQRQKSRTEREGRRSLSYDARPFYMPSDGSAGTALPSGSSSGVTVEGSSEAGAGTTGSAAPTGLANAGGGTSSALNDPFSSQRQQLGERLFPRVHHLQPVRKS